jgi:hypothetical protein
MVAVADFTGASLWKNALASRVPTIVRAYAPTVSQTITGSCLHRFVFADTNLLARHNPDQPAGLSHFWPGG